VKSGAEGTARAHPLSGAYMNASWPRGVHCSEALSRIFCYAPWTLHTSRECQVDDVPASAHIFLVTARSPPHSPPPPAASAPSHLTGTNVVVTLVRSTSQVEVRKDDEQDVKLEETVRLLLAAGYFRARIKSLSPFDKVNHHHCPRLHLTPLTATTTRPSGPQ
jgi:hypothetical protein